jgi:hypothetical protein
MSHLAASLLTWLAARFPNWCRDNALAQFEIAYSTRRDTPNRYWRGIAWVLRYFGLMFGLILAGSVFVGSVLQRDAYPIYEAFNVYGSWYIAAVIIDHFVLQFQTIARAAGSLARERQALRWDYLRLTGISDKDLIRGKWWAIVQRQFVSYLWLGVLSGCAVIWLGYTTSVSRVIFFADYDPSWATILLQPLTLLFVFASIVLLTMLNLGFTAACGLLGAVLGKRGGAAFMRGIMARIELGLLPLALTCVWTIIVPTLLNPDPSVLRLLSFPFNILLGSAVTIVDNGLILGAAASGIQYDRGAASTIVALDGLLPILSLLLSPFVFIIWLRYTLSRAERRVQVLGIVRAP